MQYKMHIEMNLFWLLETYKFYVQIWPKKKEYFTWTGHTRVAENGDPK